MGAPKISISVVKGCLVVPVQVEVYEEVLIRLKDDVARMIREAGAHGVIIDVSGVYVLDSHDFTALCEIGEIARCLGVPAVFCGFQPGVVAAMVNAGIEIPPIESALNLGEAFIKLLGEGYDKVTMDGEGAKEVEGKAEKENPESAEEKKEEKSDVSE